MAKSLPLNGGYRVTLFYTVGTHEEAAYLDLLLTLQAQNSSLTIVPFYTKEKGRLNAESVMTLTKNFTLSDFFICGPPPMMKSMKEQLLRANIAPAKIHTEEFSISS
jgi:predicted ferric reductase